MIYLFIFIYLLCLSVYFDILEMKGRRSLHFTIAITLLILVAGLRWRIGSDTVLYAQEFTQYHDLFHMELSDFESLNRMPVWVLLNTVCKTVWNDFVLVQLVAATFSLMVSWYFIRKVCPSLQFVVLLGYYIGGRYTTLNMELLRESSAVGFYLLAILSIDEKRMKYAMLYAFLAIMSHIFAFLTIIIFIICYYLLPRNKILRLTICICLFFVVILNKDYLIFLMQNNINVLFINEEMSSKFLNYAMSDQYGSIDKTIMNYISLIMHFFTYIFMLYKCKKVYPKFILLKRDLFDTFIFICILLLLGKFSFTILYRIGINYNYYFTCLLAVIFTKGVLIEHIRKQQRVFVYLVLLIIPLSFTYKVYFEFTFDFPGHRAYSRYYPYSTIFDKTRNYQREKLHQFRGAGYTKDSDY